MNDNNGQSFEDLKRISLTPDERSLMRNNLKAFIALNPAKAPAWRAVWTLAGNHIAISAGVLVLLLAGSTVTLADSAVPGDLLYPIKENFNYRVYSAVSITDDGKIDAEANQIGRELDDEERAMDNFLKDENEQGFAPDSFSPEPSRNGVRDDKEDGEHVESAAIGSSKWQKESEDADQPVGTSVTPAPWRDYRKDYMSDEEKELKDIDHDLRQEEEAQVGED